MLLSLFTEYLGEHILPVSEADKNNLFLMAYQAFELGLLNKEKGFVMLNLKSVSHIDGAAISARSLNMKSPLKFSLHFCSLNYLQESNQKSGVNILNRLNISPQIEVAFFISFELMQNPLYNELKVYPRSQLEKSLLVFKSKYNYLSSPGFQ